MKSKVDIFLSDLKKQCKEHGFKLILKKSKSISYSNYVKCAGYFDEYSGELVVATNRPDWLAILVHESCHLDQYLENSKLIHDFNNSGSIDDWISYKKEYRKKTIKYIIKTSRDLELDCEIRSVKKIKKYKLPIDTKEYTQRANAYIQFYNYVPQIRRWSESDNSPYSNKNIWSKMPKIFKNKNYYKTLPKKVKQLFLQESI